MRNKNVIRTKLIAELEGKTIIDGSQTRAYGYPDDEVGRLVLIFDDGTELELWPTGYDVDGIGFVVREHSDDPT